MRGWSPKTLPPGGAIKVPKAKTINGAVKRILEAVYKHFPDATVWSQANATIINRALSTWGLGAYDRLVKMNDSEILALLHVE